MQWSDNSIKYLKIKNIVVNWQRYSFFEPVFLKIKYAFFNGGKSTII